MPSAKDIDAVGETLAAVSSNMSTKSEFASAGKPFRPYTRIFSTFHNAVTNSRPLRFETYGRSGFRVSASGTPQEAGFGSSPRTNGGRCVAKLQMFATFLGYLDPQEPTFLGFLVMISYISLYKS